MRELQAKPSYITSTKKARYFEMGGLSSYRNYMADNKEFRAKRQNSSMNYESGSWSGVKDYDEFLTLIDEGDTDVMKAIKVATDKKVAELGKKYKDVLEKYKFDVQGQFFDVGLVLTGVPETWLEPEFKKEEQVQVEMIINGTFANGVDKKKVIKGAGHILGICKILENHDIQVKIKIVSCISRHDSTGVDMYIATDVKGYDEPINYVKCSALMSPTYLRRGVFKVLELNSPTLQGGYGTQIIEPNFIELHKPVQIENLEKKLFKGSK